jgi:hypothetical protein
VVYGIGMGLVLVKEVPQFVPMPKLQLRVYDGVLPPKALQDVLFSGSLPRLRPLDDGKVKPGEKKIGELLWAVRV